MNLNTHRHSIYHNIGEYETLNPFNDPPIHFGENDVRWIWRKTLEKRRGHIANRKFYSNYIGSKKARNLNMINQRYSGNHHLKHLVKIGCPKHDLYPILNDLGYNIHPAICSHKSHICPNINNNNNLSLIDSVSMQNVGLIFKRNAFSMRPLHIEYNDYTSCNDEKSNTSSFCTDIYVKRITNTNFAKAFRPGSYGKLQSLKKGSWKEGKIFYVFDNDELILSINDNLLIAFDLKSSASNSDNEQNTIDGWKNIVGGVGLYYPSGSKNIASVLVLRKHQNFPLECLQNSTIKIYTNSPNTINGQLRIGSQTFDLNRNINNSVIPGPVPSYYGNDYNHDDEHEYDPDIDGMNSINNISDITSCNPAQSTNNTVIPDPVPSYHSNDNDYHYDDYDEHIDDGMGSINGIRNVTLFNQPQNNGSYQHNASHYGGNQNVIFNNNHKNNNHNMNNMMFANNNHAMNNMNNNNMNNNNMTMNNMNNNNNGQMRSMYNDDIMNRMRNEFEAKYRALQYQNQLLIQKNTTLQTLNMQFMQQNTNLIQEKQQIMLQIQDKENCITQSHQQIAKLKEEIERNTFVESPMDDIPMLFTSDDTQTVMYPNGNYPNGNYPNGNHPNDSYPQWPI